MAPIRSAFDVAWAGLCLDIAAEIGVGGDVPVYCGIHDCNASLLPHLIGRASPFTVVSTGTWVVSFAVGGDMDQLDPARDTLANVDAYGRAVPSSRFMGGREFEMLARAFGDVAPEDSENAVSAVIERRLMLLPNVVPGSGPFPGAQMQWLNDAEATVAERCAAAGLYLALMTQACLDLIGAGGSDCRRGTVRAQPHLYSGAFRPYRPRCRRAAGLHRHQPRRCTADGHRSGGPFSEIRQDRIAGFEILP